MSDITFDTLKYAKKLKEAGFSEQQAEIQAEAIKHQSDVIQEFIDQKLATKEDLKRGLAEVKKDMIIAMGGIMAVGIGVIAALVAILH